LGLFAIWLAIMWAYSAPPLRIKGRPGLDLLVHGLFVETFPYWTCLYLTGVGWGAFNYAILTLLFLASLTARLEQQVRDFEIDRRYERTFATMVGRTPAFRLLQLCTALLGGVGISAVLTGIIPWRFAPLGLIGLPVLLHRFCRPATARRPLGLSWVALGAGALYIAWLLLQSFQ
jgi:lycopene elongase/hydratase (dihydrobisanhydrobacterioruberin-forming)